MIIDNGTRVNTPVYTPDSTAKAEVKPKPEVQQASTETASQNTRVQQAQNAQNAQSVQNVTKTQSAQGAAKNQAQQAGLSGQQQEQKPLDEKDSKKLKDAVSHVNQSMKHAKTKCEFSYHEETKRVSIKVMDADTDEIIREIPPEETLEMLTKMWELAGLLVDEKR